MKLQYSFCALFLFTLNVVSQAQACPDIAGLADLNCDGQIRILCFGDSITAGEQDSSHLGYPGRIESIVLVGTNVRNVGVGGEDTNRGRSRAARVFAGAQYEYSIFLEGVNDYFNDSHSASNTRSNLSSMLRSASNSGSVALLGTLTDIRRDQQRNWVRSVNSAIRSMSKIDFFSLGQGIVSSDKLHPNGSGYQRMAELAAISLRQQSEANRPADLDADGIYDFAEPRFGATAGVSDSDADGLTDGEEVFTYHTNPALTDSDGDGVSDAVEVKVRHTNPLSNVPVAPTITKLEAIP